MYIQKPPYFSVFAASVFSLAAECVSLKTKTLEIGKKYLTEKKVWKYFLLLLSTELRHARAEKYFILVLSNLIFVPDYFVFSFKV